MIVDMTTEEFRELTLAYDRASNARAAAMAPPADLSIATHAEQKLISGLINTERAIAKEWRDEFAKPRDDE
jgi:hypothetical protein